MKLSFFVEPSGLLPEVIRNRLKVVIPTFAGRRMTLELKEYQEKRSNDQNALLWSAINPHVRMVRFNFGDPVTMEQVHEDLLAEFAPTVQCKKLDGTYYWRPMRSKEMSVKQFNDYVTAIQARMAEFGEPIIIKDITYA